MALTEEEAKTKLADKLWRLSHLYSIKTKDRKLAVMKPNEAQMDYLSQETNRDIILKARQLGFSTLKLVEQLDYTIFNKNVNSAVLAHTRDKVQMLFEIVRIAFENLHPFIKPRVSYDNRNELYFPDLNSKIYVSTDTKGETVHNLHVSELAYLERAEEVMSSTLESVPKDGIISFESTANGVSGYFYEVWEDEKNGFRKHFSPWMIDENYSEPTDRTMDDLIADYLPLQVKYGLIPEIWSRLNLSKEQLNWYIKKAINQRQRMRQEYPSTPLEAFISSGRNVFSFSDLQRHVIKDPIERKYQDLLIWENPMKEFRYVIGCDPSEGIGEDNAVIEVFNAYTGEQAAELASPKIPPDELATYLIDIGNYYNKALIVLEINNHGFSVRDRIKAKYANLYRREVYDKLSQRMTEAIGWKTTMTTKPLLVDSLEEAVRIEDFKIHSSEAIKEMKTFVRTEEQGRSGFGAEGSSKDDRVMGCGLALQGIRHLPKMKAPKSVAQQKLEEFIDKKNLEKYFPESKSWSPRQRQMYKVRGITR